MALQWMRAAPRPSLAQVWSKFGFGAGSNVPGAMSLVFPGSKPERAVLFGTPCQQPWLCT